MYPFMRKSESDSCFIIHARELSPMCVMDRHHCSHNPHEHHSNTQQHNRVECFMPTIPDETCTANIMTSSSMCTDSTANVWQRIGCILSYSGNTADVVLNYCVLVINLVACIIISRTWQNTTKSRHTSALASLIFGKSCIASILDVSVVVMSANFPIF